MPACGYRPEDVTDDVGSNDEYFGGGASAEAWRASAETLYATVEAAMNDGSAEAPMAREPLPGCTGPREHYPSRKRPCRQTSRRAPSIIARAMRSFMLPVGFAPSHFARMRPPPAGRSAGNSIRGVLPMASREDPRRLTCSMARLPRRECTPEV